MEPTYWLSNQLEMEDQFTWEAEFLFVLGATELTKGTIVGEVLSAFDVDGALCQRLPQGCPRGTS